MIYKIFIRKLLFLLPPEMAHKFSLSFLSVAASLGFCLKIKNDPVEVFGLKFPNRIGLAAGFDKNAEYIDALSRLGFGFIEVGTVTPLPQFGNKKPRLFRLKNQEALINRMGFNNNGADKMVEILSKSKYKGILGVNIGKNKGTPDNKSIEDYLICFRKLSPFADYITINISSPNTAGLRDWQTPAKLSSLLGELKEEQKIQQQKSGRYVPIAVKISPDISTDDISKIALVFLKFNVDAVIAGNTTLGRDGVEESTFATEAGGLSGRPLLLKSTEVLKMLTVALQDKIPVIGCGGVFSASDFEEKISAGASLVQLYTSLIYKGPMLIKRLLEI